MTPPPAVPGKNVLLTLIINLAELRAVLYVPFMHTAYSCKVCEGVLCSTIDPGC